MTDSPWTAVKRPHDYDDGTTHRWAVEYRADGGIGAVEVADWLDEKTAYLISAAPEMLAALKLYDRTYASTQRHPSAIDESDCIVAVRAAIAKATGE